MSKSNEKFYNTNWFMWITLVLFAPVGIAILWLRKDLSFTKKTKEILSGVFTVLFFVLLISGSVSNSETPEVNNDSASTITESNEIADKEIPVVEPIKEIETEIEVPKTHEENFIIAVNNLTDVSYDLTADTKDLRLEFKMSNGFSNEWILEAFYMDVLDVCKGLKENPTLDNYDNVRFVAKTMFKKTSGEEIEMPAIAGVITVENINKIVYSGISSKDIELIMETELIHASLQS